MPSCRQESWQPSTACSRWCNVLYQFIRVCVRLLRAGFKGRQTLNLVHEAMNVTEAQQVPVGPQIHQGCKDAFLQAGVVAALHRLQQILIQMSQFSGKPFARTMRR